MTLPVIEPVVPPLPTLQGAGGDGGAAGVGVGAGEDGGAGADLVDEPVPEMTLETVRDVVVRLKARTRC